MRPPAGRAREILEHDPEKWLPVFQAQTTSRSAVTVHPELIALQRNSSDVLFIGAGSPYQSGKPVKSNVAAVFR